MKDKAKIVPQDNDRRRRALRQSPLRKFSPRHGPRRLGSTPRLSSRRPFSALQHAVPPRSPAERRRETPGVRSPNAPRTAERHAAFPPRLPSAAPPCSVPSARFSPSAPYSRPAFPARFPRLVPPPSFTRHRQQPSFHPRLVPPPHPPRQNPAETTPISAPKRPPPGSAPFAKTSGAPQKPRSPSPGAKHAPFPTPARPCRSPSAKICGSGPHCCGLIIRISLTFPAISDVQ